MEISHPSQQVIPLPERVRRTMSRTAEWIGRYGGRLAGSDACRKTAEVLQREFQRAGAAVTLEPFQTRPEAFTQFYRVDALLYLSALILLLLDRPLAASVIFLFVIVAAGLEFGWYVELYDWLYPQRTCYNVSAVLEPRGEAQRQLIFSGHHDSAKELHFLTGNQKFYALKILIPDVFRMLGLLVSWCWLLWQAFTGSAPAFLPLAKVLLVIGVYFVFTKFFLFSRSATPGAGDNLIASAMLVDLAERFAVPGETGRSLLEHTRLIFASFDAEESGLRGSRAWVRAHRATLQALPAWALNIDSIYAARDLQFLISDLNSHVALDRPLAERCVDIARRQGLQAELAVMRFGGGATDATELTWGGVRATTMIAMPTSVVREGLVYHTMRDTVEAIEPEAVSACLAVAERLAFELDGQP